ncbi:cytochrome b5-like heme/steroid binding domain-containing protein [Saccharopolyspora pogona]|uniref:cytochrome b5-like heme/steroid binding domain-containing protein n=1 Tax=Saccharopolyspora pogona TaxID=333966 RepID=UPI001688A21D|nr:cytochrome b5-like heme/steroid binding domain-containing protein [Saccharopolyspora pogona]
MADVADRDAHWIVIDDQVLDVTEFIAQHPGGCAVMYANIGRDASRDYHHVSAHHRKSVVRKIEQLGVARIDPHDRAEDSGEWQRLLDYLCLVRNSFAVQRDDTRDPVLELVFSGQSYCHLLDDHLPSFMQTLERIGADPRATQPTGSAVFASNVKSVTEGILATGDAATARAILERLRHSVAVLMDTLIRISADATRPGTRDADDSDSLQHAQQAIDHIGQWIGEEHEYWCHG